MKDFENEWAILHADIEKYERFSLVIKLVSVLACVLCVGYLIVAWLSVALIIVLWLQDGIWKTFQKRMETRIFFVEKMLEQYQNEQAEADGSNTAFQFYSQWNDKRQDVIGLIKEYLSNSAKPTVAYPYAVLVSLMIIFYLFSG